MRNPPSPSHDHAERDIEVFFPAGWFYEIVPIHMATGGTTIATTGSRSRDRYMDDAEMPTTANAWATPTNKEE